MDDFAPQLVFVTRLRHYRQRAGISLGEVAVQTRVKREYLEAFEENDLSSWPRGIYARAWVRAYASAVGLDPIDTVNEFCRLFPHGDRRAQATIGAIAEIIAVPTQYVDEFPSADRRRSTDPVRPASASRQPAGPPEQLTSNASHLANTARQPANTAKQPAGASRWSVRAATGLMAGVTKLLRARVAGPRPSRTALR